MRATAWALVGAAILTACGSGSAAPDAASRSSTVSLTESIDIGGYSLPISCMGNGTPTIILEAGYDSSGIDTWMDLMPTLADKTRVCTYDRAGVGIADNRPNGVHVTSGSQAEELHALLAGAHVEPPYVIVAHSYGGFIGRLFAARYASETAGLVLIDSSHEDEIAPYRRYYGNDPEGDWVDGGDRIDIRSTEHDLRQTARDYGDMPLGVVKAGRYEDVLTVALWNRTQADLATLSTDSVFVQATGGHFVMKDDPGVLLAVVDAVLDDARTGVPLPPCPQVVAGTDGSCP